MMLKPRRQAAGYLVTSAALALTLPLAVTAAPQPGQQGQGQPALAKKKPQQPPGGANQVEGLNGKIGDTLFTGKWRFQVLDVKQVDSYTTSI